MARTSNVSLLDDPLKVLTVVISALILFVALFNIYKNKKSKILKYYILTNTEIAPVDVELSGKIKLFFEESPDKLIPIIDSRLIIIKFSNNGKEPIKSADFEEPISVAFGNEVSILDKGIIAYPDSLKKPELRVSENTLILEPLLLNKTESITIKVLLSNSKET